MEVDGQQCMLEILDTAGTVSLFGLFFIIDKYISIFLGTIHCHERFIYEEWTGLCPCIFHNSSVNIQWFTRPEGTNFKSEGIF